MAFSSANISSGGTGCITWEGDLIDLKEFIDNGQGQDLCIKLVASELGKHTDSCSIHCSPHCNT